MDNKYKKTNKKNIVKITFMFLALSVSLLTYLGVRSIAYGNGASIEIFTADDDSHIEVSDGMVLEQPFVCEVDAIRSIMVRFDYEEDELTSGDVTINLINLNNDEIIRSSTVNYVHIPNTDYTLFDLGELVTGVEGKELMLQLSFKGVKSGELSIWGEVSEQTGVIAFDSKYATAGRDSFCVVMDIVYVVSIVALLTVMCIVLFSKEFKIERAYLVTAILVGFVMSIVIPIMVVPDEGTHSYVAYGMANKIMGIEEGQDGALLMRQDDALRVFQTEELDRAYYNEYYGDFFKKVENEELVETNIKPIRAPFFLYIFSSLGMVIGRLLGLGTIMTFMLGRWFNMLFFVLVTYYSIKRVPFGKAVLAVWALLPIMLQQVGSYSYDCGVNALSVLTIALTMNFMYGKEEMPKSKRLIDTVLLVMACLMLIPCKGHAIIPISLLPIMIIVKYLWNRREKIKTFFDEKPIRKLILLVSVFVAALVVAFFVVIIFKRLLATADGNGDYLEYLDQYAYPVGYYLKNPKAFIFIFANTILSVGDEYVRQMFGCVLGWLDIYVPFIFILPFMFMFVFAGMRREDEEQPIGVLSKAWMWIVFLGVGFLACLGMLLFWTPKYFTTIAGVQGRYFLPGLALVGLSLRTKKSCLSKNTDRIIMGIIPLLYVLIFTSIIMSRIS